MKKLLSYILTIVLIAGLLSGCGQAKTEESEQAKASGSEVTDTLQENSDDMEAFTMGVLFNTLGTPENMMKEYLDNYIGPAFNCKFIYSEACDSAEKAVNFIENAYTSGAQAILNFNSDSDIVLSRCNELGIYVVSNNNKASDAVKTLPYNLGLVGTTVEDVAEGYSEIVKSLISDGAEHNVIIVSGGAGIGNEQHKETTVAILNTLQEIYGLTYSEDVQNLATATAQTEVDTGTDIKILIYPGYAGADTYVSEMSSILQTGEYDVLLSTYQVYTQFSVAIDEVEKEYGKNILVASVAPLADATKKGFETLDSTGDTSLNAVLVKPNSVIAIMFAVAYNGLTGNADLLKTENGEIMRYECPMWVALNAEEYSEVAEFNTDESTYVYTVDDLKQMIKAFNPDLTQEDFSQWAEASDVASIKERRGIN